MIKVICVSNRGYDKLTVGAYYYFGDFKAVNPFTKDVFGNLYALIDGEYQYIDLYPRKLFTIAN